MDIYVLFLICALAGQEPTLIRQEDRLLVNLPESVLANAEVGRQLGTGLTTTFQLTLAGDRGLPVLVEIRYELWDEVYLIRVRENGGERSFKADSHEALAAWWREASLILRRGGQATAGTNLRLSLEVIPFSRSEQDRAREWFSETVAGKPADGAGAGSGVNAASRGLLNTLVTTSIKRKPLQRFRWVLKAP